jgi:hypothetical protein
VIPYSHTDEGDTILENLKIPESTLRTCKVQAVLETLSAEDVGILLNAIDDRAWAIKTLSRELGNLGIQLSDTPLTNHRKKVCACFRD